MDTVIGVVGRRQVWLTKSEAAKVVGFGRNVIDRAVEMGALPSCIRSGRRVIGESDVLLFRTKLESLAREAFGIGETE